MQSNSQLQLLLDKTEIIRLKQEALSSEQPFNIFRVLRSGHEEVGLHSRFLFELLNPRGSHGMGDTFLKLFATICELPTLSLDTVRVLREHKNIDILIQDNSKAIVIENKIYAGDQPEQLKRYFEYTKSSFRRPVLLYLTLFGEAPSEQSLGGLANHLKLISYKKHVSSWIRACINESALKPALRETLVQYNTLINQLTGNAMTDTEKQNVLELMAQGDNAEQAAIIARNWNHVRWHTEWDFWTELASLAETKFTLADNRFTEDAISKLVHGGHNKNYYYGIEFLIGTLFGNGVTFKVERGEEPMYYGIHNCSSDDTINQRMRTCIEHLGATANEWWAGFLETKAGINFYDFNTPVTLQLANPTKRQRIVGELWREIEEFVASATKAFEEEFGSDFSPPKPRN